VNTPDVWTVIREECEKRPDASDDAIAVEVMKRAKVAAQASMFLLPVMAGAVGQQRRSEVRLVERRVFPRSARRVLGAASDVVTMRSELVGASFALGDGRLVEWLKATVDEHLARIAYLQKFVAGIDTTIAAHQEAIARIQKFGGTCLGDIEDAA
jgi:hypothetical protein